MGTNLLSVPAVPGEYIVGFRAGTTPQQQAAALRAIAPQTFEPLDLINGALVKVGPTRSLTPSTLGRKAAGVVEYVQPNYLHFQRDRAGSIPLFPDHGPLPGRSKPPVAQPVNDPEYAKQYAHQNTGQTGGVPGADMKVPDAWKTSKGAGVVVAVADTNIDINHSDLAANIWTNPGEVPGNKLDDDNNGYVDDVHGWNFGANSNRPEQGGDSHGTHTSGIVAAVANNGVGVAGVAPDVKIMPLPILTSSATTANAIKAFDYAAKNGAQIISNSWGNNTFEPALAAAVKGATDRGLMVVVASGNEDWDTGVHGSYPDNYAGSVSIAASTDRDAKASYSNRGTVTIDVAAPGDRIVSTVPGGRTSSMSGTSMAAPAYAGVAALVKSAYPNLTMKQVEQRIFRSADRSGSAAAWNGLVASGGRVDAAAALTPIATPTQPFPAGFGGPHQGNSGGQLPLPMQVTPPIVVAGTPVRMAWNTDVARGQKYEVEASLNASDTSVVNEDFEAGRTSREFITSGDARWAIGEGTAKDGNHSFQVGGLGREKQSRLDLKETLPEPTELSFWYKGSRGGELNFFIDRDLQFQPVADDEWHQFKANVPAGDHTFTWLATGRGGSSKSPFAVDGLHIGQVSDARWKTVGVTDPDSTQIEWTPEQPSIAAAVRVRAHNGRFNGDWVQSPPFEVRP